MGPALPEVLAAATRNQRELGERPKDLMTTGSSSVRFAGQMFQRGGAIAGDYARRVEGNPEEAKDFIAKWLGGPFGPAMKEDPAQPKSGVA